MRNYRSVIFSNLFLILIVCSTLVGGRLRLGPASLYHYVLFGVLFVILSPRFTLYIDGNNPVLKFMLLFFVEALISVIWAPDKSLAIQYVYYIFLLLVMTFLVNELTFLDNVDFVICLMVIVLFVLNLIGVWESVTNNHIVENYLLGSGRARVMDYVPGGFFYNPNDFATYIIQIIPFSFVALFNNRIVIRIIGIANIFLSVYVIFKTSSRTQIILLGILLIAFLLLVVKSRKIIPVALACLVGFILIYKFFPNMPAFIHEGLDSVAVSQIKMSSAEGGSLGTRINLFKNALAMIVNTLGFGVGAGCHRVLMPTYSAQYNYVGHVTVMHNLIGELFADYGLVVGIAFICLLFVLVKRLIVISKYSSNDTVKNLSIMFALNVCVFLVCAISSSSIIQLSSLWISICYIGAFISMNCSEYESDGTFREN